MEKNKGKGNAAKTEHIAIWMPYRITDMREDCIGRSLEFKAMYINLLEEMLDKMQIMHRRNHYPQQLSGGQQQRVAVARAVVNKPKLILADEPTGNLDSSNGNEVMELLTDLNEQGTTIIMVTHSEHDARYSHRIIRMLDGQTVTENILA